MHPKCVEGDFKVVDHFEAKF